MIQIAIVHNEQSVFRIYAVHDMLCTLYVYMYVS